VAAKDEERAVADWRARVWRQRRHLRAERRFSPTDSTASQHSRVLQTLPAPDIGAMACPITVTKFVGTVSLGLLTVSTKKARSRRDGIS
jgi:hypothetical protein